MDFQVTKITDKTGRSFMRTTMVGDDGIEVIKILTIPQLVKILGSALEEQVSLVKVKKDFFPKKAIETYFADYSNYTCIWEVPGKIRTFVFSNGRHYHIPYPKLCFKLVVRQGRIISKSCFSLKGASKTLYYYPFGNVSANGEICMGNIGLELEKVENFSEEFFMGVTNNDYYSSIKRIVPEYSQEQLLEKLSKLDKFPEKWLVPTDMTLDDICTSEK